MRYTLHIGPRKTGSTYLQQSLFAVRDRLLQHGVYYPKNEMMLSDKSRFHDRLHQVFVRPGQTAAEENRVLGLAFQALRGSGHDHVVISNEMLSTVPIEGLKTLRKWMGDAEVVVVFYVRRWSDRLPSNWNQAIKGGSNQPFQDYLDKFMRSPRVSPQINYTKIWDKFASVFGRDSIILVSYSNLMDRKEDVFRHFLREILDVKAELDPELRRSDVNTILAPVQLEVLRVLNHAVRSAGLTHRPVRKARFMRDTMNQIPAPLKAAIQEAMTRVSINDGAPEFAKAFADMSTWSDHLVGQDKGGPLFSFRLKEYECADPGYLARPEMSAMLDQLVALARPNAGGRRVLEATGGSGASRQWRKAV